VVLIVAIGLTLAGVIGLRSFMPAAAGRPALLVVSLIAIAGAVVLNAIDSVGGLRRSRREPSTANRQSPSPP
jgi:hypothetical protein